MQAQKLPKHVAIIMDGNGRWAKKNKLAIALGHKRGAEGLREIIRYSSKIGIESLSLFAFSTENWKRSKEEVEALMKLILEFFNSELDELHRENVKIIILGDKEGLPQKQMDALNYAELKTAENSGLKLNIAINYGSRAEIIRASKILAEKVENGKIKAQDINEDLFINELYTKGQKDVDLLIRTSGEMRISNFLLYQCAYAEMVFPSVLWPEYTVEMYKAALENFGKRERRYGGRNDC